MNRSIPTPLGLAAVLLAGLASTARPAPPASPAIDGQAVLEHTKVLASDGFEGRGPGTKGEALTVEYLTKELKAIGLAPGNPDGSWVQPVPLVGITVKGAPALVFRKGGEERTAAWHDDYVAWTKRVTERVTLEDAAARVRRLRRHRAGAPVGRFQGRRPHGQDRADPRERSGFRDRRAATSAAGR